jgi:hypothetical protein
VLLALQANGATFDLTIASVADINARPMRNT